MKILFIRHGESTDDIDDQYGGWGDFDLTETGKAQLTDAAKEIGELDVGFDKILHSPLKRAAQSAQALSNVLDIEKREFVWLKEKNGYGLLSGLTKEHAAENYPDLVAEMNGGYIYGSEPEDLFVERVQRSYELLIEMDRNLICVTHGGYLSRLLEHVLNKKYVKAGDGGFILLNTDTAQISDSPRFDYS